MRFEISAGNRRLSEQVSESEIDPENYRVRVLAGFNLIHSNEGAPQNLSAVLTQSTLIPRVAPAFPVDRDVPGIPAGQ